MKNLSSLIKENSETKKYKYIATVTVEGTVTAMSEGDAGELVDKEIDTIENVTDYKIDSIDEVETGVQENFLDGPNDEEIAEAAYNKIIRCYEFETSAMSDYYKAMAATKLRMYFNK
jgi:hypothetical protein